MMFKSNRQSPGSIFAVNCPQLEPLNINNLTPSNDSKAGPISNTPPPLTSPSSPLYDHIGHHSNHFKSDPSSTPQFTRHPHSTPAQLKQPPKHTPPSSLVRHSQKQRHRPALPPATPGPSPSIHHRLLSLSVAQWRNPAEINFTGISPLRSPASSVSLAFDTLPILATTFDNRESWTIVNPALSLIWTRQSLSPV